jgi:hypothetical protein
MKIKLKSIVMNKKLRLDNSKSFNIGDQVAISEDFEWNIKNCERGILNVEFYLPDQKVENMEQVDIPEGFFMFDSALIERIIKRHEPDITSERSYPAPLWTTSDLRETTNKLKFHVAENTLGSQEDFKDLTRRGGAFWINILLTCKGKSILEKNGIYTQIPAWLHPINVDIPFNPHKILVDKLKKASDFSDIKKLIPNPESTSGTEKNSVAAYISQRVFTALWTHEKVDKLTTIELPGSDEKIVNMLQRGITSEESNTQNIQILFQRNSRYLVRLRTVLPELHPVNQRIFEDTFLTSDSMNGNKARENLELLRDSMVGTIIEMQDDYAWCRDAWDEESLTYSYLLPLACLSPF